MNGWQIAIVVGIIVAMDLVILGAVFGMVSSQFRELAERFPPTQPRADAARRSYQSFTIGMSNFGGCIHVAADEAHLHLNPARLARWFGARAMSIPWDAIEPGERRGRTMRANIAGVNVRGPAWCLGLARPDGQQPPS